MPGLALLKRLLDRPEIHAGSRTLDTVLGFISGYDFARWEANLESDKEWERVFEEARLLLCKNVGLDADNALALSQLIQRKVGDDPLRGFEEFRSTMLKVMDR